nr:hypothetical protein [Mycobacterium paragordonae]
METDPATATLPAVVTEPATATLAATAAEPATATLSMAATEPATDWLSDSTVTGDCKASMGSSCQPRASAARTLAERSAWVTLCFFDQLHP